MTRANSEVRAAREAIASAERSLASARASADQAQQVVQITNVSFRAGAATNIEVIDAERTARDADFLVDTGRGQSAARAPRPADRARPLSGIVVMTDQEAAVAARLRELGIEYARHEHPPVATVEEAEAHWAGIDGTHCKNLFLRNQKGNRHYLVVLDGVEAG